MLQLLEEKYQDELTQNEHVQNLAARLKLDLNFFERQLQEADDPAGNTLLAFQQIYLELLERQREWLYKINLRAEFDEEIIRKYLALIDLEEIKVRGKLLQD